MRGRAIRLSRPRRLVIDFLHFAKALPSLPMQRRMNLAPVVAARAACRDGPRWTAIFAKAYALVSDEFAVLRRAYVKFPSPHLYEYPASSVTIIFEREYQGEPGLFPFVIKDPARYSLADLDRQIRHVASAPIDAVKSFRRSLWLASLPRPLRRLIWWIGLNIGRQRGNYFGTFGLSVYYAPNTNSVHPLAPLTTLLNYDVIAADGQVNVRIVYDHRVLDGATVARVLARLEEILKGPIVEELAEAKH
jgi:hypothetical protein